MTINVSQLRRYVVDPVLLVLSPDIPYSTHASDLLMGTAAQESDCGTWLHQTVGPALGVWQMEPATMRDHIAWLSTQHAINDKVMGFAGRGDPVEQMPGNLYLACAMARVHYWRVQAAMPTTLDGQAAYWKQWYNTPAGGGSAVQYIQSYKRLMVAT